MKKTKKIIKNKEKNAKFKASVKVMGKTYTASGNSVREAIENLKPSGTSKGLAVLTMSNGDLSKDRILPHRQTIRLFSLSPLMREIALKNTALLFEGIFI